MRRWEKKNTTLASCLKRFLQSLNPAGSDAANSHIPWAQAPCSLTWASTGLLRGGRGAELLPFHSISTIWWYTRPWLGNPSLWTRAVCSRGTVCAPQHLRGAQGVCVLWLPGFPDGLHLWGENQLQVINCQSQVPGTVFTALSFYLSGDLWGWNGRQWMLFFHTMTLLAVLPEIPGLCFRWLLIPGPRTHPCFRQKRSPVGCAGCFWVHGGALWHLEYLWWSQATTWGVSEWELLLLWKDILSSAVLFCSPPVVTSNGWMTLSGLLHCLNWCLCARCFLGTSDTFSAAWFWMCSGGVAGSNVRGVFRCFPWGLTVSFGSLADGFETGAVVLLNVVL